MGFVSVTVNNVERSLKVGTTLLEALSLCSLISPFAVAINGELVTKANYQDTLLRDGDVVDIVYPMQGG